ncbi:hypothetical protein ER308_01535 [Egibacter rhizosphaerae]|uniref:Uncharacterized protein n=1 Tax=Egibacter rhizosphaerae TaxID=1670831 RepID=A0A411YAZ7_9ACTN|nr:hypothetical protein [Egibacter rhizosphaerae]QBI18381.1 hypothetical protein ER308_01535 [Egibacter rhizosphaerae]
MTRVQDPGPHPGWRWFALLGGMSAYALHLIVSYYALPAVCAYATRMPLYVATVIALAVAAGATVAGWRHRRIPPGDPEDPRLERQRFMSRAGVVLSLVATLTIIAAGAATLLFDPCQNWV